MFNIDLQISDALIKCAHYHKDHIIIKHMLEILLTILLIVLTFVVYKVWIKPIKTMNRYVKLLEQRGYKVNRSPYNPLRNDMIYTLQKGQEQGDALKLHKQRGREGFDVTVTNLLIKPKLEFIHPDFVKDFFSVDKHYDFPKEQKVIDIFTRAAGHGLPFSEGEIWKRKRTILNKVFNFDFVKSQSKKISDACAGAIQELESGAKKGPEQKAVTYNILDLTVQMFSEVMMISFLGGTKHETIMGQPAGKFLKKLVSDLSEQSFVPINFLLGIKFLKLGLTKQQKDIEDRVKAYRKWGLQFIRKRIIEVNAGLDKNNGKTEAADIIQALLIAKRKGQTQNSQEQAISTQEQIFEEFNAFFIAGTDTTSNFTQMMIYAIARDPQIEAKVREEIEKFIKDEDYSFENLKNLKYIDLLQKQTTRYYGPGTHLFPRSAKRDNFVNGLPVKEGTSVAIMQFSNHFSDKYFKNPDEFRPERWESECDNLPAFVYGGFSAGARTCIGKHLAMMESKIALVKFMKRYKQIILPKKDFRMEFKFLYSPQEFETKMIINDKN